jgi:tetratricopeptide (TPR) repeat protein
VLQRTLPRLFRTAFLREADLLEYDGDDPRQISTPLRSARWTAMCEAVDVWPALDADSRCRLVLLLHALCFYSLISELLPRDSGASDPTGEEDAELGYWGASARYVLALPSRVVDYAAADLSEFAHIVAVAPDHEPAAFNAALKILTHKAKTGAPTEDLLEWRARAERIVHEVGAKTDAFTRMLLLSRFHRAAAFVPQRCGDRREVVRVMDVAEQHARALVPADAAQELLYLENLHPLLESRAKEALWLGDLDLALHRALGVIELDGYDSRAWLELGEVRRRRGEAALAAEASSVAATLGTPSSAIARHMAGLCFRNLGQPLLAAFFFRSALEVDPHAISPHEEIQALPDVPVLAALKEWSLDVFDV